MNETKAPRNPWFAAALSLLAIGVGHIYSGRIVLGLLLFASPMVHLPLLALLAWIEPSLGAMLLLLFVPVAAQLLLYLGAAGHAFATAAARRQYTLRDYNRPAVYIGLTLLALTYPLLVAVTIRDNLFEAYVIPTNSMAPTINRGDRVLCNKLRYRTQPIRRGDLVVFKPPGEGPAMTYVKRVIGLPGDTVAVERGRVTVNGERAGYQTVADPARQAILTTLGRGAVVVEESLPGGGHAHSVGLLPETPADDGAERGAFTPAPPANQLDMAPLTIPEGKLFLMGDHRPASKDSRMFGPVDRQQVLGRLEYRYLPLDFARIGPVD